MSIIFRTTDKLSTRLMCFSKEGYKVNIIIRKQDDKLQYNLSYNQNDKEVSKEGEDLEYLLNGIDERLLYEGGYDKDIFFIRSNIKENQEIRISYKNETFEIDLFTEGQECKTIISENLTTGLKDIFK